MLVMDQEIRQRDLPNYIGVSCNLLLFLSLLKARFSKYQKSVKAFGQPYRSQYPGKIVLLCECVCSLFF